MATTASRWMTATKRLWPGSRVATNGHFRCLRAVTCRPCSALRDVSSGTLRRPKTSHRKRSCAYGHTHRAGAHLHCSAPGSPAWWSTSVSTANGARRGSNWRRPAILLTHRRVQPRKLKPTSAITLTYGEGMSNAEVAEILDTSVSAVETLLVRGKQNLRHALSNLIDKDE
jgi:DNA-binding CsgD family transcriptional regulator